MKKYVTKMMNVRKCHLRKSQHEEALAFRHLCIQHCCTIFFFNWTIYYGSWKHALKIPTNMHTKIVMWTRVRFVCVLESSLLKTWSKIQAQIFQILGLEQKEKLKDFFSSYCDRQKKGFIFYLTIIIVCLSGATMMPLTWERSLVNYLSTVKT